MLQPEADSFSEYAIVAGGGLIAAMDGAHHGLPGRDDFNNLLFRAFSLQMYFYRNEWFCPLGNQLTHLTKIAE